MNRPVIIVHGGAWDIPDEFVDAHIKGCERAVLAGWDILKNGGSALDAVEEAIKVMEDDPTFDAGIGSFLNEEGFVELDALIMDGASLNAGAVACVRRIKNPISLARKVLELTSHILLIGEGAEKFAKKIGFTLIDPKDLIIERELKRWLMIKEKKLKPQDFFSGRETVGAVALDVNGNIAAGVSTGGIPFKMPGRVGDTPIIGAGAYADNSYGGVAATGYGEAIMRILLSKTVIDYLSRGFSVSEAAKKALELMYRKTGGRGGIIVIDKNGNVGYYHTTTRMAFAYVINGRLRSGIKVT